MHATSEFVLRRGCWFMLQGERENCCVCEVQHIITSDDSRAAMYVQVTTVQLQWGCK